MKAIVLMTMLAGTVFGQALPQGERDRLLSHLHATRKMFLDATDGLSKAQWEWKPSPEVWSVAETAEHIVLTESALYDLVTKRVMSSPADPSKKAQAPDGEGPVLKMITDRSQKAKAPEQLVPHRRWQTGEEIRAEFKTRRDKTLEYVRTTQDALRTHYAPHPAFGQLDGWQWLFYLSGHSERHTEQIKELKSNPAFPKN